MKRLFAIFVLVCACTSQMAAPPPQAGGPETPPADAGSPDPTPGIDAGTSVPVPTLMSLEPAARTIQDVSPDGKHVLVSPVREPYPQGLSLVTRNEATKILVTGTAAWGSFTPDGRSIVFTVGNTGEARGPALMLARGDGSGARLLAERTSFHRLAGRWLYYTDESDTGFFFYRLEPPDGMPELLATYSGQYDTYQALWTTTSPDGKSIAYCIESPAFDCYLLPAGSATAMKLPSRFYSFWAPDGSWLLLQPCQVVDMAGTVRKLCDASSLPGTLSPDGTVVATLVGTSAGVDVHLISTSSGEDVVLPRPGPYDPSVFRARQEIGFTPDGSRVIAILGHASFSMPVAGGSWTLISPDHGAAGMSASDWPVISPDSRIIADLSSSGLVESIGGGAPQVVRAPEGAVVRGPLFEPRGGLDKAIFFSSSLGWLANADGTGDWLRLPAVDNCQWFARTALCQVGHSDPVSIDSNDLVAVTDDGKQIVTLVRDATSSVVSGRSIFYISSSGGLYVFDDGLPAP